MTFKTRILIAILMLFAISGLKAQTSADAKMMARATPYFGMLMEAHELVWEEFKYPSTFAAQVEKESLWNPKAVLCVPKPSCSREKGIGFGQMTITPKMNVFNEVKGLHPALKGWQPDDYFNPQLQLIAIVAKDRMHFKQCTPLMANDTERTACMLSSYNGGFGGFSADRRLCSNTEGCKPQFWYGNVEGTSLKAKTALPGYGHSFFQINRSYVRMVWLTSRPKYAAVLDTAKAPAVVAKSPEPVVVTAPGERPAPPLATILPGAGTPASIAAVPEATGTDKPILPPTPLAPPTPVTATEPEGFFSRLWGRITNRG